MSTATFKNMTKEQLLAFIENQAKNNASGLIVKVTEKGGIFIKHDSFKEFSVSKEKDYIAGVNLGYNTAKALFGNPALLNQIVESMKSL